MSETVISATLVTRPRHEWACDSCLQPMGRSPHLRLYGSAHSYEKPYRIRICVFCAEGCAPTSAKVRAALAGGPDAR